MDTNIIIALIGLLSSVLVQFGGILINSKLTNYRIEQLEKEVQKHNNLVERVYKLEQDAAVQEEKIAVANHRIDDLERAQND
jgi:sensor histidine kinase YesM